jgi:phage replication O-like protein O
MASPQLENGYLRLSNELAEALTKCRLNGSQFRIILLIIRETYGRNRGQKTKEISLRSIAMKTGLHLRTVRRELTELRRLHILESQESPSSLAWGIQKNYELWF